MKAYLIASALFGAAMVCTGYIGGVERPERPVSGANPGGPDDPAGMAGTTGGSPRLARPDLFKKSAGDLEKNRDAEEGCRGLPEGYTMARLGLR